MHAANSAATLRDAEAQFDMVRCGIAIYGMDPFGEDPAARGLEPALELSSYLAEVKPVRPGRAPATDASSWPSATPTSACSRSATATAGGAGSSNNADVLIAGHRHPLVGTVSMDSITVDLGLDHAAEGLRGAARDPDRLPGQRAHHSGGGGAPPGHDQLRGHLRADAARAARLSPRRRADRRQGVGTSARAVDAPRHERAGLDAARSALAGTRAWLVGGAVRDRVLGTPDRGPRSGRGRRSSGGCARGRTRSAARGVLCAVGGVRFLAGGGARRLPGRWMSSRCEATSIEADLALRDFTVNAIAEPLAGGARSIRWAASPTCGPGACGCRRRLPSREDPLRVLRLVRLAVELDLEPDAHTLHAAARACRAA